MIKTLLTWGLIFVGLVQAVIALKLFKFKRQPDTPDIIAQRKKLDMFSRTIQVIALVLVIIFIFNGGLSK